MISVMPPVDTSFTVFTEVRERVTEPAVTVPENVSGPITMVPSGLTPNWEAKPGLGLFSMCPSETMPPSGRGRARPPHTPFDPVAGLPDAQRGPHGKDRL
ncbi:hypothetical protein ABZX74_04070 [Streptomyces olivaceoviridis]|uniref:hypothetical protein n=1 Tax=Streptomyces olivaceoviridis TaxID=1921 RepID=UPI0033AE04E9